MKPVSAPQSPTLPPDQPAYVSRLLEGRLTALLAELPALFIVGPRATGKTTTAARHAATIVSLDSPRDAVAFRADPDAALRGLPEPVLLDEWQAVPEVLGALKRSVDADPRPGRYLVTGSVQAGRDAATWPGTGRLVRLPLYGLTPRELNDTADRAGLLDRIRDEGIDALQLPVSDPPDLRGYLELALQSGFPEPALRLGPEARTAWLESYAEQVVTRDARQVAGHRDPDRLRRYLEACAATTGRVVEQKTLWTAAGINRKTALAYEQLLRDLFLIDWLPAWSSNRLKQLVRGPKRVLVDSALAASLAREDVHGVLRDGRLLGGLLETFVVALLRAEAASSPGHSRLFHLRDHGGRHEVDVIVELGRSALLGIEVKATAAPDRRDARHLEWLRDHLPDRFAGGLVLHTGPATFSLAEDVVAAPIAALWS